MNRRSFLGVTGAVAVAQNDQPRYFKFLHESTTHIEGEP